MFHQLFQNPPTIEHHQAAGTGSNADICVGPLPPPTLDLAGVYAGILEASLGPWMFTWRLAY